MLDLAFRTVEKGGGRAVLECDVGPATTNPNGMLHGGAIATLVDHAGTLAIASADREGRYGVTTDLNVSYLAAAPEGMTVRAEARALRVGRTLAYVEVNLYSPERKLLAQGRMTKFMPTAK